MSRGRPRSAWSCSRENPEPVDKRKLLWQPQKKWSIYCVAYSHHDLGFGDYPHRLRTTIRHANITRPLQFCRDSDAWDEDSKFRFMIETSEPITSFLGSQPPDVAEDLARRLRKGRIQHWRDARHRQHRGAGT